MSEQRDFVDFNNGGDTGQNNLDSIQPLTDGEGATQIVLRRSPENIRSRTEILRDEIEELKYYRDYGQLMIESNGNVTWGGASDDAGTGFVTSTATLRITPLLAPLASTKGTLTLTGASNQVTYTISATGFATQGMNAILVEHRNVTGTTLSASITKGPVKRIVVFFDSLNGAHTASAAAAVVVTAVLNDSASDTVYGITGKVTVSFSGTGIIGAGTGRIEGTADAELHVVTAANLGAISLAKGDGIAIWYRHLIEPSGIAGDTTDPKGVGILGGRAESTVGRPNASTSIPSGSLFKTSASASKIPGAIPICRVANNGQLIFFDGTRVQKGETISFASATSVASAALTAHIANLATLNGAGLVGYNGSASVANPTGVWADGVVAIASGVTVEAAIDEIVSDLAATSAPAGALHIGVDAGTIFSGQLTAIGGGGGQSSDTNTRAALDRLDSAVVARRGFTAVCTDGTASVGGDVNAAALFAGLNTQAFGSGRYFVRRGTYTNAVIPTTAYGISLVGEYRNLVTLVASASNTFVPTPVIADAAFEFENMYLTATGSGTRYTFGSSALRMQNCRAQAGIIELDLGPSPYYPTYVEIDGLTIDADAAISNANSSLYISNAATSSALVTGVIKDLRITQVPTVSGSAKHALLINQLGGPGTSEREALVFENCRLDPIGYGSPDGNVLYLNTAHQPLVYRDCLFRSIDTVNDIVIATIDTCTDVLFENCKFVQDGRGKVLDVKGSSNNIRFKTCEFYTSPTNVNYPEIGVFGDEVVPGKNIVFEDCYVVIRRGSATGSSTQRRIEIGTVLGVASGTGSYTIDGLHVLLDYSNVTTMADYTFSLSTGADVDSRVEARNLTLDFNGKRLTGNGTRAAYLNGFSSANLEVDGLNLVNVTEPDTAATPAAVTLTNYLVEVSRGRVNGGTVNGTPAGSNVAAWKALVSLNGTGASCEGLRFYESSAQANKGRCIFANERCKVIGNTVSGTSFATGEDTPGWFVWTNSDGTVVDDNTVVISGTAQNYLLATDNHAMIYLGSSSELCALTSNTIRLVDASVKAITVEGDRNTVVSNGIRCDSATADTMILLTTTAAGNVVTANTMLNEGAGTATVTDNGTSTTAPNRVFGNPDDISVGTTVRIVCGQAGSYNSDFNALGATVSSTSAGAQWIYGLDAVVPDGAIITLVRASVDMSAGQASSSDRMYINFAAVDILGVPSDIIGPVFAPNNSTAQQYISTGAMSYVVDKSTKMAQLSIGSSINASNDQVFGIEITYTTPKFYID